MILSLPTERRAPLVYIQLSLIVVLLVLTILFWHHLIRKGSTEFREIANKKPYLDIIFLIFSLSILLMIILSIIEICDQYILTWQAVAPGLWILFIMSCLVIGSFTFIILKTHSEKFKKDWRFGLLAVIFSWILCFSLFITLGTLWNMDYGALAFFLCLPMFIANVIHGITGDNKVSGITNLFNVAFAVLAAYFGLSSVTSDHRFWFSRAMSQSN